MYPISAATSGSGTLTHYLVILGFLAVTALLGVLAAYINKEKDWRGHLYQS